MDEADFPLFSESKLAIYSIYTQILPMRMGQVRELRHEFDSDCVMH